MELKWLEDLVCVAEKGHFARAAEVRHITQSALSRRIRSLELWVGAELFDRSQHPIALTAAGEEFIGVAYEIINRSHEARHRAAELNSYTETGVTIACLHTLALYHVPNFLIDMQKRIGAFESKIVAETRTVDQFLSGLVNGSSDFFISFTHPSVVFGISETEFPKLQIGQETILPYQHRDRPHIDLTQKTGDPIPHLEYAGTSFLSRVVNDITRTAPFVGRLKPVYSATLAEGLCTATTRSLGMAWLPSSVVENTPKPEELICLGEDLGSTLGIHIYRSASNDRPVVNSIWKELSTESPPSQTV